MPESTDNIKVISYKERYTEDFTRLNCEWIEGFGLLEDADAKHLNSPRESIIEQGGQIFFAIEDEVVLGTCPAIHHSNKIIEIAKLAVVPWAQRRGVGRMLTKTVIDYSRDLGVRKIILVSSTELKSALRLYISMGFVHAPLPVKLEYASADVYMELKLSDTTSRDF